jgi:hypothetical protein
VQKYLYGHDLMQTCPQLTSRVHVTSYVQMWLCPHFEIVLPSVWCRSSICMRPQHLRECRDPAHRYSPTVLTGQLHKERGHGCWPLWIMSRPNVGCSAIIQCSCVLILGPIFRLLGRTCPCWNNESSFSCPSILTIDPVKLIIIVI